MYCRSKDDQATRAPYPRFEGTASKGLPCRSPVGFGPGRPLKLHIRGSMRHHCLLLLAYAMSSGTAFGEVKEHLEYSYYEVRARSDQPLFTQLNAASPIREGGQTFYGHTNWNVRWAFKWKTDSSGVCRISTTTTELHASMILPRLDGASARQMASFDRFMSALRQHELGHYKIALVAAQAIDIELRTLPGMNNCKALDTYANTGAQRTLERYNERSRQYDRDTNHGRTQGAWIGE
jgi:predicted secreted Zn-dependent protease